MTLCNMDVLHQLTLRDIIQLHNFYEKFQDGAPQIWNFLHSILKWCETDSNLIRLYAPNGEWFPDGTFIAILEFNCYEIYMHTTENSCKRLSYALKHTKLIKWKCDTIIYALHENLQSHVIQTLLEINVPICFVQENTLWRKKDGNDIVSKYTNDFPHEMGNFYLDSLKKSHAKIINEVWPYRYEGSEEYVRNILDFNGGVGIFKPSLKSDEEDELVAWVLKNGVGMLGFVQTKREYKRMGLASWAVKAITKKMAAEELIPMCTIALGNEASQKTFIKCGFTLFAKCCYIGIGTGSSIAFDSEYDCGLKDVKDI